MRIGCMVVTAAIETERSRERHLVELVLNSVSKRFGGVYAVEDVSVTFRTGEVVGLIGPNGAGKTTLLNIISSALPLDKGEISLDGQRIENLGPRKCAIAGIGRTFQNIRLFKDLTVRQNLEVARSAAGRRRAGAAKTIRLDEILDELGISGVARRKAGELPYGHQRRVEVARALALSPNFLLLDEPTAGMVEGESEELVASIRRLRDWMGCGIVIIDHDLHFITNVCEQVYVLDHGRLIAAGAPSVIREDPKVAEVYLGYEATETH